MNRRIARTATVFAGLALAAVSLSACEEGQSSQQQKDNVASDKAYEAQAGAVPFPAEQLTDSLERRNLAKRLLRENKANQIRYVYLLGDTGTYIGYYTIKGKVSSNQSQMLPQDDVTHCRYTDSACPVTDGPGDDGSFGDDAEGQFFFTTDDVMVSTDMRYIVSDQPLPVEITKGAVPQLNGK